MPVNIIDTLKPKNGGNFPIVEAADIAVSAEKRLPEALAAKANANDVTAATNELHAEINQIVISSAAETVVAPEVAQARVGANGVEYNTLKNRLDTADEITSSTISDIHTSLGFSETSFDVASGNSHPSSDNQLYYPLKNGNNYKLTVNTNSSTAFTMSASAFAEGSDTPISIGTVTSDEAFAFTASADANRIGLYISSKSEDIHYDVRVEESNSLLSTLADLESEGEKHTENEAIINGNIDDILGNLGYSETSFSIASGSAHSSTKNQLYFPLKEGETYVLTVNTNASSAFTMSANVYAEGSETAVSIGTVTSDRPYTFTAPIDANRIGVYISTVSENIDCTVSVETSDSVFKEIEEVGSNTEIIGTDLSVFKKTGETSAEIATSSSLDKSHYITGAVGSVYTVSSYSADSVYTEDPIDVSDYAGGIIRIQLNALNSTGSRTFGFCNSSKVISSTWKEKATNLFKFNSSTEMYEANLPITDTHFFFSYSKTVATTIIIEKVMKDMYVKSEVDTAIAAVSDKPLYISPTGSDSNVGSAAAPLATVNKALELGASNIRLYGGTYEQTIDLSKSAGTKLILTPCSFDEPVLFTDPARIITEASTAVAGYTYVKSATLLVAPAANNRWIWQDGVADVKSEITAAKRHPLQRGMEYRRTDTRIIKTSATTLADALNEIESNAESGTYKWFFDDGTIYFASPETVSNTYPICCSLGNNLFENTPSNFEIEANGIESKYLCFNVSGTIKSTIRDCKSTNVYAAGAFVYNNCLSVSFIRCEAATCVTGENGDGFNGHANLNNAPFAKQCTCILEDCWSHDNNDDGYSDHERAETTIIGGLFEANSKGGVVPSYGSHCTCYNVLSRDNYSGFLCTGAAEAEEGGIGTQMICYNCVAQHNQRGGKESGFCVDSGGNKMTLINCKSIDNTYGYTAYTATDSAELIDCGSSGNTVNKNGSGTFTITNTSTVE